MIESILPNLFVFYSPNQGSNAFLLVGKKTVLIDASGSNNSETLLEELNKNGFEAENIDSIIFTHGHADHFTGAKAFPNARLLMHKFDAEYVNHKDEMFTASAIFGSDYYPKIDSFLESGKTLDLKPFKLEVIHTPGHTKGSVCLLDKSKKLLFSGDTLFKGGVGRFDLLSGNREDLESSINMLKGFEFETLLPGHGLIVKGSQSVNIESALKALSGSFI